MTASASPRAATDRVPLRLSLAHAMHLRHRNLMLNIEHLAARVGQLYAMVVPLARPIQYRGGGGGVVAAPAMPPDAAPMAAPVPPPAAAPIAAPAPPPIKPPIARWSRSYGLCTPINQVPAPTQSHREQETPSPCPDLLRKGLT